MSESMREELARRARWLIESRSTDGWASSGAGYYRIAHVGGVFVQDSAGVLTVHLRLGPVVTVEVYWERDGEVVPKRIEMPDREHMTVLEMRKNMILDDIANV
jgi:hypothetical protein